MEPMVFVPLAILVAVLILGFWGLSEDPNTFPRVRDEDVQEIVTEDDEEIEINGDDTE